MKNLDLPQLVAGDFNAITSTNEHHGGSFVNYAHKYSYFIDFINRCNLPYNGYVANGFAWCND